MKYSLNNSSSSSSAGTDEKALHCTIICEAAPFIILLAKTKDRYEIELNIPNFLTLCSVSKKRALI